MALPGEIGWIGKNCPEHGVRLETRIMRSAAGYFVGTQCPTCRQEDPSPHSRETGYYPTKEALKTAVLASNLNWRDSNFHPGELEII